MTSPLVKQGRGAEGSQRRLVADPAHRTGLPMQVNYWRGAPTLSDPGSTVQIAAETDVANARRVGLEMSARAGFTGGDQTVIAAAIAEVAQNIVTYAGAGEIILTEVSDGRPGLVVVARDSGPGMDVPSALREGFSTVGAPGLGLNGVRRLMDVFEIASTPGKGTTITMTKWRTRPS